jgi:hypothetical protein
MCLPDRPSDKTFNELCTILRNHFKPKVLEVAETYHFHHTYQSESESVTEYANKSKRLSVEVVISGLLRKTCHNTFLQGVQGTYSK